MTSCTPASNRVASAFIRSNASAVSTCSSVARIAATDRALPARVPPIPPTSTRSASGCAATAAATSWVSP